MSHFIIHSINGSNLYILPDQTGTPLIFLSWYGILSQSFSQLNTIISKYGSGFAHIRSAKFCCNSCNPPALYSAVYSECDIYGSFILLIRLCFLCQHLMSSLWKLKASLFANLILKCCCCAYLIIFHKKGNHGIYAKIKT